MEKPSYKQYLEAHARQCGALLLEICHYCPVGCAHCHVGSGPSSKLALDNDAIVESIKAFSKFPDSEYIMCTGGEPFSFPKKLKLAIQTTKEYQLKAYTLTSGSWATNPIRANRVLNLLPKIDLFAVSVDQYHESIIGLERPKNAIIAAVNKGYSTFICIGHMGLNDPFRQQVLDFIGEELLARIDIIYYPLLARGSGRDLPELEGRELSRSAKGACFSVGAPIVVANGKLVACCHSSQANNARQGQLSPLVIGDALHLEEAIFSYANNKFLQAIRTVGPAEIAKACQIETPQDYENWDICRACEYLHDSARYSSILNDLENEVISRFRIEMLDEILSKGSSSKMNSTVLD